MSRQGDKAGAALAHAMKTQHVRLRVRGRWMLWGRPQVDGDWLVMELDASGKKITLIDTENAEEALRILFEGQPGRSLAASSWRRHER